jgi:hypothetical protein
MGLFSWTEPEDNLTRDINTLKTEVAELKGLVSSKISAIEGLMSKTLRLYEQQDTDIVELRRAVLDIVVDNTGDLTTFEDVPDGTDLSDIFKPTRGLLSNNARLYYNAVLKDLSNELGFTVFSAVRLDTICHVPDDRNARYRRYLKNRSVDFVLCNPESGDVICAIRLIRGDDDGITAKLLDICHIPFITVNRDDSNYVDEMREDVRKIFTPLSVQ